MRVHGHEDSPWDVSMIFDRVAQADATRYVLRAQVGKANTQRIMLIASEQV